MPDRRLKITHTQGVVAKIAWISEKNTEINPYTGILKTGSHKAIIRLSQASILHELSDGLTPSFAIKFFIDGNLDRGENFGNGESQDIVAMPAFTESGSWNFLEGTYSNHVAAFEKDTHPCEVDTLVRKLRDANRFPYATSISQLAERFTSGFEIMTEDNINAPFKLEFESPLADDPELMLGETGEPWYEELQNIPRGTILFHVFAWDRPEALGGTRTKIADIVLNSELHTSLEGDNSLFFRHQPI